MVKTQNGMRLHIGFFGKRNAGKSTLINKISGQNLSIVSDIKGTTTDVNQKAMELLPIGPVNLIDTAGIDDIETQIGNLRVEKTNLAYKRCDVIVFVADFEPLSEIEKSFLDKAKKDNKPILTVINKTDIKMPSDTNYLKGISNKVLFTSNEDKKDFTYEFKNALVEILPEAKAPNIMADIVKPYETVVLVIPIDKEAPKGRIILPQVNTIREALDYNITSVVTTVFGLKEALNNLKNPPKIVITDSQSFKEVDEITPKNIMLTSFSILFARMKGDLKSFINGANKLNDIQDNDKILILESCTHHPVEDDIGRVKIPNLIKKYTGCNPAFEHYSGHDFPVDISKYKLIIHCGACMTNRSEVMSRIKTADENNIPITNYGIVIAKCLNILDRALIPFLS